MLAVAFGNMKKNRVSYDQSATLETPTSWKREGAPEAGMPMPPPVSGAADTRAESAVS